MAAPDPPADEHHLGTPAAHRASVSRGAALMPPVTNGVPTPVRVAVSVVVASFRGRALLDACLSALRPQCERHEASLVVARAGTDDDLATLRRDHPDVLFVQAPVRSTIPELRGLGLAEARGDLVALTEDHCLPAPDWLGRLVAAPTGDIVGGGMGNARRTRALDWAAYFAEYGFFASGIHDSGDTPALTGANVAYRRPVVDRAAAFYREGEWENVVHARLAVSGAKLTFLPDALVSQNGTYRFGAFCRDRYEHGRDYARRRVADERGPGRWVRLVTTPLLPPLLAVRVARAAAHVDRAAFARALPITVAFLGAWALGEAVGYWLGPVTTSMAASPRKASVP